MAKTNGLATDVVNGFNSIVLIFMTFGKSLLLRYHCE